jgi:hypothetical protein
MFKPSKRFWAALKRFAELLTIFSLLVGLLAVARQWQLEDATQRRELAESTYDRLDERYVEFQKLCMENPGLDCYDVPLPEGRQPVQEADRMKQKLLYTIALCNFERAYLHFNPESGRELVTRAHQWEGWSLYMDRFLERSAFQRVWLENRCEFDRRFMLFFDAKAAAFGIDAPACPKPKGA